jgi:hypothetical protein
VQTQLDRQREEADRQKMAAEAATRSNTLLRERLALYSGAALEGVGASGRLSDCSAVWLAVLGAYLVEPRSRGMLASYPACSLCLLCRARSLSQLGDAVQPSTRPSLPRSSLLAFPGSIPGDALSVPVEELERALAIVRKRLDRPTQLGSEVTGDAAGGGATSGSGLAGTSNGGSATQALVLHPGDADGTPAALRKRVQQLQLALLTAQGELDRSDRMVRVLAAAEPLRCVWPSPRRACC